MIIAAAAMQFLCGRVPILCETQAFFGEVALLSTLSSHFHAIRRPRTAIFGQATVSQPEQKVIFIVFSSNFHFQLMYFSFPSFTVALWQKRGGISDV